MIRFIEADQIDASKWDECIQHSYNRLIYAYSWYLDCVCQEWCALVMDDYEAVMPLIIQKKWGINYCFQPPYSQQHGIFGRNLLDKEVYANFFQAIPKNIRVLHLQFNAHNWVPEHLLLRKKLNLVLELIQPYEEIKKRYSTHCKRAVNKSHKNTCTLLEGISNKEILDLVRWQNKEKNLGLDELGFSRLERLINQAIQKGVLRSIGVYSPVNHLCSVGLFLKDGQRLYYLIGASDQMGNEYRGMYRIMDYLISQEAGQNLILDFEGSEIEGIARFFRGFGAEETTYPVVQRVKMGFLNNFIKKRL